MKNITGSLTTYLAAAILLSFGFVYLIRNSFMPYHSAAVSLAWTQVDQATQYLLLALMRATAGGFISLAFAIIVLQYKIFKTQDFMDSCFNPFHWNHLNDMYHLRYHHYQVSYTWQAPCY